MKALGYYAVVTGRGELTSIPYTYIYIYIYF